MPYTNTHRGARISPTKIRLIADLIRHKSLDEADTILRMSRTRGAVFLLRGLQAARENARNVGELSSDDMRRLVVSECRVDQGPVMKRWQPKDRGRAHAIKKRTSHIVISVDVK
ncbi:MAG: 50S ribosomal protein L22 [Phycisphaeraceae bacterium]|nr:50S ribosomal protein L22 [Phycisphaeraceae bacterium]